VSLVLGLSVLVALTAPMLALLSASTFEPWIARNQVDATQALYVAEAGIEWAFDQLVNMPDWNAIEDSPTTGSDPPAAAGMLVPPDDLLPWGTATITVRRGARAGEPSSGGDDGDEVVVVTSVGTVKTARRTIEVLVKRSSSSPPAGRFDQHTLVSWGEL
jgi:Tfp pilus assembly protein PilX